MKTWIIQGGNLLSQAQIPSGAAYDLAISPDGTRAALAEARGALTIWNLGAQQMSYRVEEASYFVLRVAFSPDGLRLASSWVTAPMLPQLKSGEPIAGTVQIHDVERGTRQMTIKNTDFATALAFKPDGASMAVGSLTGMRTKLSYEEGFRFHLPAYMRWYLRHWQGLPPGHGGMLFVQLSILGHKPKKRLRDEQFFDEFTPDQKRVIARFLEFMCGGKAGDFEWSRWRAFFVGFDTNDVVIAATHKRLSSSKSLHEHLEFWAQKNHAAPGCVHPEILSPKQR